MGRFMQSPDNRRRSEPSRNQGQLITRILPVLLCSMTAAKGEVRCRGHKVSSISWMSTVCSPCCFGPLGGIASSINQGAAWPLVVFFAIIGFGIGIASAKLLGAAAYACLCDPRGNAVFLIGYLLLSLTLATCQEACIENIKNERGQRQS